MLQISQSTGHGELEFLSDLGFAARSTSRCPSYIGHVLACGFLLNTLGGFRLSRISSSTQKCGGLSGKLVGVPVLLRTSQFPTTTSTSSNRRREEGKGAECLQPFGDRAHCPVWGWRSQWWPWRHEREHRVSYVCLKFSKIMKSAISKIWNYEMISKYVQLTMCFSK